jgi:hypothetical protein
MPGFSCMARVRWPAAKPMRPRVRSAMNLSAPRCRRVVPSGRSGCRWRNRTGAAGRGLARSSHSGAVPGRAHPAQPVREHPCRNQAACRGGARFAARRVRLGKRSASRAARGRTEAPKLDQSQFRMPGRWNTGFIGGSQAPAAAQPVDAQGPQALTAEERRDLLAGVRATGQPARVRPHSGSRAGCDCASDPPRSSRSSSCN